MGSTDLTWRREVKSTVYSQPGIDFDESRVKSISLYAITTPMFVFPRWLKFETALLFNRQVDQARDFELKSLFEHLYYNYKVKLIFNNIVSSKFSIYSNTY